MIKKIFLFLILFINQNGLFSQNPSLNQDKDVEELKKYEYYTQRESWQQNWCRKFFLKNGLISKFQDIEDKQGLTNEFIYYYDKHSNIKKGKYITNMSVENKDHLIFKHRLTYNKNNLVVEDKSSYGWVTLYSEFNELGKPQIIKIGGKNKGHSSKEKLFYDENGNTLKSIKTTFSGNTTVITEVETIKCKYDGFNNCIALHRAYKPKKKFPIMMIGVPHLFEYEYYQYVYNDDKLWVKKTMSLEPENEEILSWKREYKKH
jgi:hypothetical protein